MTGFSGCRIVESLAMTKDGDPYKVKRSWRERLFSLPWRPLKSFNVVTPKIPSDEVIIIGRSLVMHPEIARRLKEQTQ